MSSDKHETEANRVVNDILRDVRLDKFETTELAMVDHITAALRSAYTEGMKASAVLAAGWETHAGGSDYQFDGKQYWDAGNVYDQARLDASQRILIEAGAL